MKTSARAPLSTSPQATPEAPLDWRVLVGWLREDGVISADEAARTVARCASAQSTLHPLERLAVVGVARTDGTLLDVEALAQWLAPRCGLDYVRIDPLKVDVAK